MLFCLSAFSCHYVCCKHVSLSLETATVMTVPLQNNTEVPIEREPTGWQEEIEDTVLKIKKSASPSHLSPTPTCRLLRLRLSWHPLPSSVRVSEDFLADMH